MSAEATGWVWRHSPYQGSQLLVHLAIADVVNDAHDNEFWMSTAALARKARVARSTVIEALAHMTTHGYLRMVESGKASRSPSRYAFVMAHMTAERSSASALSGHAHDRWTPEHMTAERSHNSIEITQEPKGAPARSGDQNCARCHGRGQIYNATGGFDIACSCVSPEVNGSLLKPEAASAE